MPEGVEVKVITNQLNAIAGETLECTGIEILGGRFSKEWNSIDDFNKKIRESNKPANIKGVYCKGKFIYFTLDHLNKPVYFFSTLGMTGEWSKDRGKHTALALCLEGFGKKQKLYFNDIRHFGTFKIGNQKELEKKLKSLGSDMLSDPCSLEEFKKKVSINKNICVILMDQKIISGVGNYIKAESLYKAGISPHRIGASLTQEEMKLLYNSIIEVMKESYKMQGASLITYKTVDGSFGGFQEFLQVYGKKICNGFNVIKETTLDGRTTHWVPEIQR